MQAEATTKPYHARLAKLEQALSVMHTIVSKEMVMPGVDDSSVDTY
ncbi:hypothetical protein L2750_06045 [Shewanella submarina]|uniref:Uncharacterized protein n=1 Tax=Shewanella submarina TaxID=2016376 RepID=A0ABV7GC73_9GAMM|nr:hypothetical protein [Shewanella submarina]MCL1036711.1 hypothetical protein [Shewanella submarina]